METARSPKFLGDPRSHLPCSQTSAGPPRQAIRSLRCCPCVFDRKDSRDSSFGAQSHGFCDRCLRFTAMVTQGRARLASDCGPGFVGMDWLPSGSLRKVSAYTHPPFPSFAWRDKQNTSLWNAADFIASFTEFIPPLPRYSVELGRPLHQLYCAPPRTKGVPLRRIPPPGSALSTEPAPESSRCSPGR
jgi:hypothetical protein